MSSITAADAARMNHPAELPVVAFTDLAAQYRALKPSIDARIQRVLDHGQYIMGPEVEELEARLAERCGARHCVTVASGTEALLIALMALGVGPGDEVVTSPFTFAATAEAIVLLGAVPVFVDVEPDTGNLDAGRVESRITSRTRAILPVSLYGQPADMDAIDAIAARHGGLPVIEDAAQSFGATYRGRSSGHLSTVGCTSFFPSKPLGAYGDGGALFTDDDAIAQASREIRVHGQAGRYHHVRVGVGGRMDTLQCAIVLAKLERFDWELRRRREIGQRYAELIARSGAPVGLLAVRPDRDCVWGQYTVFVDRRDAVRERMQARGVPCAVHYPKPLHHQPAYADLCPADDCPESVAMAARVLSLPMSADLDDATLERIVATLAIATDG